MSMRCARSIAIVGLAVAPVWGATRPAPTACGNSAALSWEPLAPQQGALFLVRVSGVARGARLEGEVAGQPLHFRASGDSSLVEAFAAAPIDGNRSLGILVRCVSSDRTDTLTARLEAARASYPVDKLKVAPEFGRKPDSATAVRIERESARALAVAKGAHSTPLLWSESFVLPRESRITSGYGRAREFNGELTSRHMGTDFAGAVGAPVRAVNRGVVRIVDSFYYGGNVVYLDHGAGLTSAYLHLSKQSVAAGDTVEREQLIGEVGASGRVTGPHLHFILRYGDITVDPMSLYALAGKR